MRVFGLWLALLALAACQGESEPETDSIADIAGESSAETNPASIEVPSDEDLSGSPEERKRNGVGCAAKEEAIFSCRMPGGKHLAVCAPESGPAEYRFGGDTAELTLTGGKWSNTMYSGGGESQILISNGDTDYIVFSRMVRTNFAEGEPNYPAISDGVVIQRGETVVAMRLCEGGQAETPVQYGAAERAFGPIEDLFTGATERADARD